MAFEHRSWRHRRLDHLRFDLDPGRDLAAATPLLLLRWMRRHCALFHAARFEARFDTRPTLQTFQPGDLLAQFGNGLLQRRDLAKHLDQQSLKLGTA